MTTEMLDALNAVTDSGGPEHSMAVRTARAALRHAYLAGKMAVTGDVGIDPASLIDMDKLDAMVGRWLASMRRQATTDDTSTQGAAAVAAALQGQREGGQ